MNMRLKMHPVVEEMNEVLRSDPDAVVSEELDRLEKTYELDREESAYLFQKFADKMSPREFAGRVR